MRANGAVVFGADTEEGLGDMKRRVHKIPTHRLQPAMITGACLHGHLMDTAVERIFRSFDPGIPKTFEAVDVQLGKIMDGLYSREFRVYPDQNSIRMQLLVAAKPREETKAGVWVIDCNVVRRMESPHEIVGVGELVHYIADHLHYGTESLENVVLETVQLLSAAKSRVQGVGGESYVHWLRDDGTMGMKTFRFSPETESLYDYYLMMGRSLLLATGTEGVTEAQFDEIADKFIRDMKWKRAQIFNTSKPFSPPSNPQESERQP
jgi:hypothetical protein